MQIDLPQWVVWVIGVFVLIGAGGGVFFIVRIAAIMTKSYLLLIKMTDKLEKFDLLSSTLFELAHQFKNDSGSSALDKIEKLQEAGVIQREDAAIIKAAVANVRAEQTALAVAQARLPATTQSIYVGDVTGQNKSIGQDEVKRDKQVGDQIVGNKQTETKIEGTLKGTMIEVKKEESK